ncbi:MAG: hypothetical protein RIT24_2980 [Planctomycetota bacterium]
MFGIKQQRQPEDWVQIGDSLEYPVAIHPELLSIARSFAQHRLRQLRAIPEGFVRPLDVTVAPEFIRVQFAPGALRPSPLEPSGSVVSGSLVPLLEALLRCESVGARWRGRSGICRFRCIPGVRWFVPQNLADEVEQAPFSETSFVVEAIRSDLNAWALAEADRRTALDAVSALHRGGWDALGRWLEDWRRTNRDLAGYENRDRPSRCLTEFELFDRVAKTYRYRIADPELLRRFEIDRADCEVLSVDRDWVDPHFGKVKRAALQELWDELTQDSQVLPKVMLSGVIPDPLRQATGASAHWIGTHADQPFVYLRSLASRIPNAGYLQVVETGDDVLMSRKRLFADFADRFAPVRRMLASRTPPSDFSGNSVAREALEDAILSVRGIFAVQGPPGTGKTHLVCGLVQRFFERTPEGRVLICAKEHFALDHVAGRVTERLSSRCVPFRAWRSIPLGSRRRDLKDSRWSSVKVDQELAALEWRQDSVDWQRWQSATSDLQDLRISTLGRDSANVVFATTCDHSMAEFLGNDSFDLVIVEEAGKCYPSELLHALCLGRTAVMIGDQFQLPPYRQQDTLAGAWAWKAAFRQAKSDEARRALHERFGEVAAILEPAVAHGDAATQAALAWLRPFERFFGEGRSRYRLTDQFRMEAPLSRLIGKVFYGEGFTHRKYEDSGVSCVDKRPLGDAIPARLDVPLLWIDTPHMVDQLEATEDHAKRGTRDNLYEVNVVTSYLRTLRESEDLDFVILTPYRAQKRLLIQSQSLREACKRLSRRPLEELVRTADEYQGREAQLTVLTLVRNNGLGSSAWGFVKSPERLNVLFSRARFRQVVVGCSAHVVRHREECEHLNAIWNAYCQESADATCARVISSSEVVDG